jgi:Ala-tRNA(Pro) deacylase
VDLQELRAALGLRRARLATEKELAELFPDCELGPMPPLGNLYKMPTYVESSLAEEEWIAFNGGTHRDVVYLRFEDFRRLVKPVIVHFARLAAA